MPISGAHRRLRAHVTDDRTVHRRVPNLVPKTVSSSDRRSNEDGPARLSIVARSDHRFTQRPDTLTRTVPSPMTAACGSGADHTFLGEDSWRNVYAGEL